MPFALAMLICGARSALPVSAWSVTAFCTSGSEHTRFQRSLICSSSWGEAASAATLGCVRTCGSVCILGMLPSLPWGKPVACDAEGSNSAVVSIIVQAQ